MRLECGCCDCRQVSSQQWDTCTFVWTWASLLVQALQWAEVEGGPKSPLLCDLWYFANRFTFLKVFTLNCIGHENDILGQGVDQVVQAERVWQLCPLCGKLLQIHTPSSASSIQVVVLAMVRQLGVTPKYVPSTMGARDSQRKSQIESQRKSQRKNQRKSQRHSERARKVDGTAQGKGSDGDGWWLQTDPPWYQHGAGKLANKTVLTIWT